MEIVFTAEFAKKYRKIKDIALQMRVAKALEKLKDFPYAGKPLQHNRRNQRSIRVEPFRIIYEVHDEKIIILTFGNRDGVY